jgi:hypothetical protein
MAFVKCAGSQHCNGVPARVRVHSPTTVLSVHTDILFGADQRRRSKENERRVIGDASIDYVAVVCGPEGEEQFWDIAVHPVTGVTLSICTLCK